MEPRCKLWLEHGDDLALSDYRVRLLATIGETGSLSAASTRLGLSYRRAWGKVRELERNLGFTLVESVAGGAGGGGSRLTAEGAELVRRYTRFADEARRAVAVIYDEAFSSTLPTDPESLRTDRPGPR
ncbi:MAG: molybdate transport system regulatory protein [Chloroflexi bacterium]|nr:MAG: molybdate transport system regulatory protein [Chloroflexota bacterium]